VKRAGRAALILLGGLCMLSGLDAALVLLGLPAPLRLDRLARMHGILMVLGFLGTVISLERAVALRRWWGYLAPAGTGAGSLLVLTAAPVLAGQLVILAGCLVLAGVYLALWQRARDAVVLAQLVSAVLAVCAVLVWIRTDVATVLVLFSGFLVVTIAAERVELARLMLPARAEDLLLAGTAAAAVAGGLSVLWPAVGGRVFGVALAVSALWLLRHDVARRTVRARGLPRFAAMAMLAGYVWLLVAAACWLLAPVPAGGWAYDTVVHAVFLGFAMSMVMAHAPVILPSVLKVKLPYHPVMWVPLVVLHGALLVRVTGSLAQAPWYQPGAVGTIIALLLLVLSAVLSGRLPAPAGKARPRRSSGDRGSSGDRAGALAEKNDGSEGAAPKAAD